MARYTAYVMDISYFSGKFEAYLRYKEIPYEEPEYEPPREIVKRLTNIELSIAADLKELEGLLK